MPDSISICVILGSLAVLDQLPVSPAFSGLVAVACGLLIAMLINRMSSHG